MRAVRAVVKGDIVQPLQEWKLRGLDGGVSRNA